MEKKISPAAAGEKFLGVNFQLVKIIVGSSQRKFFKDYSLYGNKSLPAVAGENFLGLFFIW